MPRTERVVDLTEIEGLWPELQRAALSVTAEEPALASFLHATILSQDGMASALAYHLAQKLGSPDFNAVMVRDVCAEALAADPGIIRRVERDLRAVRERDPACRSYLQPFLYYKGLSALQAYRVGHWLWSQGRQALALHLQSQISERFQVDIHPAAVLGSGIFLDHATGVVIGETSVVEDGVSILQNVTLGGTGKERGDRHPKIGRGVLISVGAKILGNIRVGEEARIAAGSVVLHDVPAHATVAGVPAKIVRGRSCQEPAKTMDHLFEVDHFIGEGI